MPRKSVKQWLIAANGWQRLWFVGSVMCFLYGIIIFPLTESNKGSLFRYEGLWSAEKEMKNPICAPYMNGEFDKLIIPDYSTDGSTCYHIYSHRQYSDDHKPITESTYQQHFQSSEREMWLKLIGFGFVLSTLLNAFVYGVGVVVTWVVKGFKRN
jgi:hypothetical protein